MGREHISPWRRTRRRHDAFRRRRKGPSSRSRKLADYIIATNDAQPDGTVDRRLDVDVRLRVCAEQPCVRVPPRVKAIVLVTESAREASAASRDGGGDGQDLKTRLFVRRL